MAALGLRKMEMFFNFILNKLKIKHLKTNINHCKCYKLIYKHYNSMKNGYSLGDLLDYSFPSQRVPKTLCDGKK